MKTIFLFILVFLSACMPNPFADCNRCEECEIGSYRIVEMENGDFVIQQYEMFGFGVNCKWVRYVSAMTPGSFKTQAQAQAALHNLKHEEWEYTRANTVKRVVVTSQWTDTLCP